ncbi:MAG: hypothetical protein WC445_01265 [Patescibacteria group bacterium]
MSIIMVCDRMKWTYEEYLEQPKWFIDTLRIKWNCEAEREQEMNKKNY